MTEQEFRELTAYQPPTPPKQSPPVSSIAASVAAGGNKGADGSAPPVPPEPVVTMPPQAQHTAQTAAPPQPIPVTQEDNSPLNQFVSQINQQQTVAPVQPVPLVSAPAHVPPAHVPATVPESNKMVPHEKHSDLMEQFTRLGERHKRMLAERDALAKQVAELKQSLSEKSEGHDYKEEIRLLGKLIDNEQSLRKAVVESGTYDPGNAPYARHDRLVEVFLNIVARSE